MSARTVAGATALVAVVVAVAAGLALVPSTSSESTSTSAAGRVRQPTPSADAGTVVNEVPAPRRPVLEDPEYISIEDGALRLDSDQDYVLTLPCSPIVLPKGLRISGGNDVVLVGGSVELPDDEAAGRALYLVNQTGTVHIEGVRFTGNLGEGINLSQSKGAAVHLVNIAIDGVLGGRESNHADLIQTWAGPRELVVDGFVGSTNYQGFFLLPNQHYDGPPPESFRLRDIHIKMPDDGGYALWQGSGPDAHRADFDNVWISAPGGERRADKRLWPKPSGTTGSTWEGVNFGTPPTDVLTHEPGADYPRMGDQCT